MSEMVERVAAALFEAINPGLRWDSPDAVGSRLDYARYARTAIEATREPTRDMTEHQSYISGEWSRRNIEAYIDAAIQPRCDNTIGGASRLR